MGFSNIVKHKYSWALNRIGCVYLKVVEGHFVEAQQTEGPNNEGQKELTG